MSDLPRMLAGFVQGTLESIDAADADLGRRVRARLGEEGLCAIEDASRIAFVPLELDVALTDALFAEAGAERAREIFRANMSASFDSPILNSFVRMALRLRGGDPGKLFEFASRVWSHLFRGCGDMRFERVGPGEGRLELDSLPEVLTAGHAYLDGVAATASALYDLVEVDGEAHVKAVDAVGGRAIIRVTWEPSD